MHGVSTFAPCLAVIILPKHPESPRHTILNLESMSPLIHLILAKWKKEQWNSFVFGRDAFFLDCVHSGALSL